MATAMERPRIFQWGLLILLLLGKAAQADDIQAVLTNGMADPFSRLNLSPLYTKHTTKSDEGRDHKPFKVEVSKDGPSRMVLKGAYRNSQNSELLTAKTAYSEGRVGGAKSLLTVGDWKGGWNMQVNSSVPGRKLKANGEFGYSGFNPETGYGFGKDQHRFSHFGIKNAWRDLAYGFNYQYTGNQFTNLGSNKSNQKRDRRETQLWGSWWRNRIGIKASVSHSYNNLAEDPKRPRFTDTRAGITLDHKLSSWPGLGYSLSYSGGMKKSSREPAGYQPYAGPQQAISGSLHYKKPTWTTSLNSSYTDSKDLLNPNRDTVRLSYGLRGSYYPRKTFRITPALSYMEEHYQGDGSLTRTQRLSLSLDRLRLRRDLELTGFIAYSEQKNRSRDLDKKGIYAEARLRCSLSKLPLQKKGLSFYITYNQQVDELYPSRSSEDFTVGMALELGAAQSRQELAADHSFDEETKRF